MNFSEFKRLLGAEPRSQDPEFLRARQSSIEFEKAADDAERFESKLERALSIPAPDDLVEKLATIPARSEAKNWWPMALAASILIAVGAAGLAWKLNPGPRSVEEYLVDHYRHDGEKVLARADGASAEDVQNLLSELSIEAAPALADFVSVIKSCPTPDGKGIHMILNTETGPVTVFYLPNTEVTDREMIAFDDMEAVLVDLRKGSAAIIGPKNRDFTGLYALVYDSIFPSPGSS